MKTVTFNPLEYKLVSIEPTAKMMMPVVYHAITQDIDWTDGVRLAIAAAPDYPADAVKPCIDELIASVKALVACKGRFHTQQNFERLALAYKNFEAGNSLSLPPAPEGV